MLHPVISFKPLPLNFILFPIPKLVNNPTLILAAFSHPPLHNDQVSLVAGALAQALLHTRTK